MSNDDSPSGLFLRWVRATWGGWVLGVPCIVALALIGEAVGVGGAQVLVGAGMGTGVGLLQARALRGLLPRPAAWFWACVGGLALPFLAWDIATRAGWGPEYSLEVAVAIGGLIVGCVQALILRRHFQRAALWIAASAIGWALAGTTSTIADSLMRSRQIRGIWGALAYLGIVAAGGLVLGMVTGLWFRWIRRPEEPPPAGENETG